MFGAALTGSKWDWKGLRIRPTVTKLALQRHLSMHDTVVAIGGREREMLIFERMSTANVFSGHNCAETVRTAKTSTLKAADASPPTETPIVSQSLSPLDCLQKGTFSTKASKIVAARWSRLQFSLMFRRRSRDSGLSAFLLRSGIIETRRRKIDKSIQIRTRPLSKLVLTGLEHLQFSHFVH